MEVVIEDTDGVSISGVILGTRDDGIVAIQGEDGELYLRPIEQLQDASAVAQKLEVS